MAEFPAFPLWTDAYLADTGHLSTVEHGAYLLLLMTMWRAGGKLPNDDKMLARYTKSSGAQWARLRPILMEFFTVQGSVIVQNRLVDELQYVRDRSRKQSENARSKSRKNKDVVQATAKPDASQTAAPTPTPIKEKKPTVSKKGTRIPDGFAPDIEEGMRLGLTKREAESEAANFRDYWLGASGAKGVKLDWPATWRMWCRNQIKRQGNRGSPQKSAFRQHQDAVRESFEKDLRGDDPARAYDDGQPSFDLGRQDYRRN